MTKKVGFTLAEVLITLAIIGVVAAMTLPTLIQKHQKRVLGERFKQSLSILSQGFQKMMADEEVTDFYETTLGRSDNWNMNRRLFEKYFKVAGDFGDDPITDKINGMGEATDKAVGEYCESHDEEECESYAQEHWSKFEEEFNKAYNGESDLGSSVVSLYQLVTNGGFDPLMLFMQNGLTIGGMVKIKVHDSVLDLDNTFIIIDTNGNAKPNKEGYDRFTVTITDTGLVVPVNSIPDLKYLERIADKTVINVCYIMNEMTAGTDEFMGCKITITLDYFQMRVDYFQMRGNDNFNNSSYGSFLYRYISGNFNNNDVLGEYRNMCKENTNMCGAYLYQNNFVMDY